MKVLIRVLAAAIVSALCFGSIAHAEMVIPLSEVRKDDARQPYYTERKQKVRDNSEAKMYFRQRDGRFQYRFKITNGFRCDALDVSVRIGLFDSNFNSLADSGTLDIFAGDPCLSKNSTVRTPSEGWLDFRISPSNMSNVEFIIVDMKREHGSIKWENAVKAAKAIFGGS